MKEIFENYIKRLDILDERLDDDFSDLAFAYDYNEVQELFFNVEQNDFVILAGASGLRKKDMLSRICRDLYASGVEKEKILYLDYELPILHGEDLVELVGSFAQKDETRYLVVNELQEAANLHSLLVKLRNLYPKLKLIASSSVPHLVYETLYDKPLDYCKVVVLSQKNGSNVKYRSEGFGVFDEFKYNVKDGYVEIKGLTKRGKGLPRHDIPSRVNGLPVKVIASGAFHDRVELTQITIPEGVEMIGDYAFSKCSSLTEIKLPSTLKYVGDHAFLGATKLAKIEGGANIEHVGNSALYATAWLAAQSEFAVVGKTLYRYLGKQKQVVVPNEITFASAFCFADSTVESVTAPSLQLSEGMFYRCKSLKQLELSFTQIPPFAFYGCESLPLCGKFDAIGRFALYDCKGVTAVEASQVGECALAFSTVAEVAGASELASGALYECGSLRMLQFEKASRVGSFAVCNTQLKQITFNGGVVGDYAFYNNSQLSFVDVTAATSVGRGALYGCRKVTKMRVGGKIPLSRWFAPETPPVKSLCVVGDVADNFCRNNAVLCELELTNVNNFGRWSFYGNVSLAQITFHNVTRIGDWAFAYCTALAAVNFPLQLTYIGMNAFRYCRNLNYISLLPNMVVPFGPNAFYSTGENKTFVLPVHEAAGYYASELWGEYIRTSKVAIRT